MFRRVLVSAVLASVMALGCGGGEVLADSSADDATLQQDESALETPCSRWQDRGCGPFTEVTCQLPDGQLTICYCQDYPFNQWQCPYPT